MHGVSEEGRKKDGGKEVMEAGRRDEWVGISLKKREGNMWMHGSARIL